MKAALTHLAAAACGALVVILLPFGKKSAAPDPPGANQPSKSGKTMSCKGEYRRLSGYTEEERKQKLQTITLDYTPEGDMLRVSRIRVQTRYGNAVADRR